MKEYFVCNFRVKYSYSLLNSIFKFDEIKNSINELISNKMSNSNSNFQGGNYQSTSNQYSSTGFNNNPQKSLNQGGMRIGF